MSDETTGAAPDSAPAPIPAPTGEMSEADAVSFLAKRREAPEQREEAPDPAADRHESGDEPDAATPEEPSGETEDTDDTAGEPPIDPPSSWTAEEKEAFKALPRDVQRTLAARERERRTDIDRRINDAAEKTKAAEAERQAAEQARQQYEAALPNVLNAAYSEHERDFPDIKTQDDVQYLARTDKGRYLEWLASANRLQAIQSEQQAVQQQRQEETAKAFEAFVTKETDLFLERMPDYRDPKKGPVLREQVKKTFADVGISEDEMRAALNGRQFSFHDHRIQMLVEKARRYDAAQAALKQPKPAPTPNPVQKPGPASSKGERGAAELQQLHQRLEKSGSDRDAVALLRARRRA